MRHCGITHKFCANLTDFITVTHERAINARTTSQKKEMMKKRREANEEAKWRRDNRGEEDERKVRTEEMK